MWQCAGDKLSHQTHQQPFCYFLLLFFRDDDGYSSAEIVLHVKSHAPIPVGCFIAAVDGSPVDNGSTEPVVVMESVTCQVTSCWWQHRGWGKKALGICDMRTLEMAENQMVWNSSLWARHAGDGWTHTNYCVSQMKQCVQPTMGEKSKYQQSPLVQSTPVYIGILWYFFIHLHIDYCIDLLKWLVKNGSCNCLSG